MAKNRNNNNKLIDYVVIINRSIIIRNLEVIHACGAAVYSHYFRHVLAIANSTLQSTVIDTQ